MRTMHKYTTELVDLTQGSEQQKHQIAERIFNIFSEKTGVVSRPLFYDLFFKKRHRYHALYIFNLPNRHPFGFLNVTVDECRKKNVLLIHVATARSDASRHYVKNITVMYFIYQLMKIRMLYPSRKIYITFTASSPASYYSSARFARRIYPNGKTPIPTDIAEILQDYTESLLKCGVARRVPQKPGVIIYNELKMMGEDTVSWRNKNNPHINYYLSVCDFEKSEALVGVLPCQWADCWYAVAKIIKMQLSRLIRRP